jgi:hypothetical protein
MFAFKTDEQFAKHVAKGNLAELLFERLAIHSGWFVRYTGDQYHKTISPENRTVLRSKRTPDFCISLGFLDVLQKVDGMSLILRFVRRCWRVLNATNLR